MLPRGLPGPGLRLGSQLPLAPPRPARALRPRSARAPPALASAGDGRAPPRAAAPAPEPLTEAQLKRRLQEVTSRLKLAEKALQSQEDRARALAPYRVSAPKRGIVGNSRYAKSLRKEIVAAARDPTRRPVLIFGEPGLQKLNIAALVHFGFATSSGAPLVSIDCDRLDDDGSELLGRGAKRGLLSWVPPEGTIVLNNVHKAPASVLPLIQREVATASMMSSMDEAGQTIDLSDDDDDDDEDDEEENGFGLAGLGGRRPSLLLPRILMTAEARLPAVEAHAQVIKVPPLRVRAADVGDLTRYFLRRLGRERGLGALALTPAALRNIEARSYPNNVSELEAAVNRAVVQATQQQTAAGLEGGAAAGAAAGGARAAAPAPPTVIGEEVFWFASQAKDLRLDLLRSMPLLRGFLRSEVWPQKINFGFTAYAFAAVVALLFLGPQDRAHNVALNVFWCDWWALSFVAFPFLGRVWCSVCPFMIYGELVQRWRRATGATLLKWPREAMEEWGPWFLFWLFAGILVWEEVWDLPGNAALSSWLLLLITGGAMVGSFFFERRIWCRYLCPIGGMNGLFAKLSMTELRARQGVCSAQCDTYSCYKGGPATPPEGMESLGCPVYSHPAQLTDNRNCVLCMDCLKACPHSSIEFRLRVPGADLWNASHKPLVAEAWLMFMLLGAVPLHHLPQLLAAAGVDPAAVAARGPHMLVSAAVLAVPGAVAWGADAAWRAAAAAMRPAGEATMQPALAGTGGGGASVEGRAVAALQRAAAGYSAQASGAPVVAPIKPFLQLGYGYLPLVWAATLAHYEALLLREAGLALQVGAATFGLDGAWLPVLQAHPAVVSFCQGGTLLFGAAASLGMTRRVAGQPWRVVAPQCALVAAFTAGLWALIVE